MPRPVRKITDKPGQIVISTGKSDWEREITEEKGSLASHVLQVQKNSETQATRPKSSKPGAKAAHLVSGIFKSTDSTRVSILNGSHNTLSCHDGSGTVLVFPDYKVVSEVPRSLSGAKILWDSAVDPAVSRYGVVLEKSPLRSWVIPYSCVILLCENSHHTCMLHRLN